MSTQVSEQQSALKDAMARAKEIAAKLQQVKPEGSTDESTAETGDSRKRSLIDTAPEPVAKKGVGNNTDDPKAKAQQIANSIAQWSGLGSMLVEEITIPNKLVGMIIGRGGEMINKLQSESGAKIQVAPDPDPDSPGAEERQVTITGAADAVNRAKNLIDEIRNAGKVPERLAAGSAPGEFYVQITIPKGKVGLIIGKGGENIKSLQERAGCKMMMFQDGQYANALEKPLRISGEQGAVMYGKKLIQDLLAGKELEGVSHDRPPQYSGQNYKEIQVPRPAVGLIIGAKGANIHQIQMETGCRIQFKNEMEGPTKTAMLTGNPHQVGAAEQKIREIIAGNMMDGPPRGPGGPRPPMNDAMGPGPEFNGGMGPRPLWDGPPGPQGPGGPQNWGPPPPKPPGPRNTHLPPDHKEVMIEVPRNKCGIVIGKGGENIKFIKSETKADIELNRDVPENLPFKVFRVQGNDEKINKVLEMIREKTGDSSIVAKPADGSEPPQPGPNQWGPPPQSAGPWGPPQPPQNQMWGNQQQWPMQQPPAWGQPQPPAPQNTWNQPPQPAAPGWNQPAQPAQPTWDPQQQQWQHTTVPPTQWTTQPAYNPAAQPYQMPMQNPLSAAPTAQPVAPAAGAPANPTQAAPAPQATAQPDYSAAWALYYQQQQYYQQYAMQQAAAVSAAPAATVAAAAPQTVTPSPAQTPGTPTSVNTAQTQAQAMADYQAKLKEYYKQFGQQVMQ